MGGGVTANPTLGVNAREELRVQSKEENVKRVVSPLRSSVWAGGPAFG